jgi:hypothetical protein
MHDVVFLDLWNLENGRLNNLGINIICRSHLLDRPNIIFIFFIFVCPIRCLRLLWIIQMRRPNRIIFCFIFFIFICPSRLDRSFRLLLSIIKKRLLSRLLSCWLLSILNHRLSTPILKWSVQRHWWSSLSWPLCIYIHHLFTRFISWSVQRHCWPLSCWLLFSLRQHLITQYLTWSVQMCFHWWLLHLSSLLNCDRFSILLINLILPYLYNRLPHII